MKYLAAALVAITLSSCASPTPEQARICRSGAAAEQPLFAGGHDLFEGNGKRVRLRGFNYFGFNNGQTMVDGVWGGPGLALDFASVVHRQKLLGFNAVRLPFSFKDLKNLPPKSFVKPCNIPTAREVAASVVRPGVVVPKVIPPLPYPPHRTEGQCNGYLPNDSTWNRYKWVVSFYARNGFYVLIDNHLREDPSALEDGDKWAGLWAQLVKELVTDPEVKRRLMVDILNEPGQYGVRWEAADGKPGLGELYLKAMDAIYKVAPKTPFFIEGTGQDALQANWGDGFDADNMDITNLGLSNPRPFFAALASRAYGRQVVLAPHVYGPAVTTNENASSGKALNSRLSRSFGSLMRQGFCSGAKCITFPVAIGEFGSKFTDARDVATMNSLRSYLLNTGEGDDGKHFAIQNWFYWSWNANSGDTGGIVQDDWVSLNWNKLDFLQPLGLRPLGS